MANDFLNPPAPNDVSQVGSLAELCSPFQASAKSCFNDFVFTPTNYSGDTPVVKFLSAGAATPLAPDEPGGNSGYVVTPGVPQPSYSPDGTVSEFLSWQAGIGPSQGTITSYQFTMTPGTGSFGAGGSSWRANLVWCTPGTPNQNGGTGSTLNTALGITPGQVLPPGFTATAPFAGNTVTFTVVSGNGLRGNFPGGETFYRDASDASTDPITVRFDFAIAVDNLFLTQTGDPTIAPPEGFTNFMTARVQTANYSVCFTPTNSGYGVYPFQIDYTEGALPINTENVQFTFTNVTADPATAITQTGADGNGTLDGVAVPNVYEFHVGPTGGPYGTVFCADTPVSGANPQSVTCPITGLTPNTQYCYVVVLKDTAGGSVIQQSAETCFTTLAAATFTPECNPATNITSNSADLQGTVDGMDAGHFARIEVATAPGGPYTFATSGLTAGDTTVNQLIPPVSYTVPGLTLGTTYYYRVAVYSDAGGTIFTEASGECSFTVPNPTITCAAPTGITQTQAQVNGVAHNAPAGWDFVLQYATVSGGPYTTVVPTPGTGDGTANQNINAVIGPLTPGTTYFTRWQVSDPNTVTTFTSAECPSFQTQAAPPAAFADPPTNVSSTGGDGNGHGDNIPPTDNLCIEWGTTPGGPYPATACCVPGNNTVGQTVGPCSLGPVPPGTQICYRVTVRGPGNTLVSASTETCFFTTNIIVDPCEAPTAVTPTSATLHGTVENAPAGYTVRFRYSTTPGGPYTSTVVAGVTNGSTPFAFSAPIVGLPPGATIYYISETLNPAQEVVAASPTECSFPLTQATGPAGFVFWCGRLVDSGQCVFVPDNEGGYWNCNEGI